MCMDAAVSRHPEVLQCLCENGVPGNADISVHAAGDGGRTLLYSAAYGGTEELVRALIRRA